MFAQDCSDMRDRVWVILTVHIRFCISWKVSFQPKRNVHYRSRFRLTVRGGEGAEVVLEGTGTYRENTKPGRLPKV